MSKAYNCSNKWLCIWVEDLELAMACHLRVASENSKMGLPEVSLGVIPGYGGTQRLPQLIGKGRALDMIMTAKMIDADEALALWLDKL